MRIVVAALLFASILAGCSSNGPGPAEFRFTDAEVRFSGAHDNATTQTHTFTVPDGASYLIERHAFETPGAWAYRIEGPDGESVRNSGLFEPPEAFPGTQTGAFQEVTLEAPPPGEYTVEVGCTAACAYTAAFDFQGGIGMPFAAEEMHRGEFTASAVASSGHHESARFPVPDGTRAIVAEAAWWADGEFSLRIEDSEGARRTNIGGDTATQGRLRYSPTGGVDTVPAGEWELDVDCERECRYSLAIHFVQ